MRSSRELDDLILRDMVRHKIVRKYRGMCTQRESNREQWLQLV
jgi:hypothetical protein